MLEIKIKSKLPGFILDVSFSVNQEILAILGPSGSGKTMTLRSIAGLTHPEEGFVRLNNKVLLDTSKGIDLPARSRKVGFVFQNYSLFPHLTVHQNIAYGINHLSRYNAEDRVADLLDKMHISQLAGRFPRQLSAGQQQRVAVARALAPEPDVLLLDEPFSALDTMVKERMHLVLQAVQNFYKGDMLFVTHDLSEGYKLGSRIAVFESGRIVQHDSKEKVIFNPSNNTVARLVGFKNLIAGTVAGSNENAAWIKVPELGLIRTPPQKDIKLTADQKVTLGIRPEYIELRTQHAENTFEGTMERKVDGVSATDCYFHIKRAGMNPISIVAMLNKTALASLRGEKYAYLYFPPEHVVIIPN